MILHTVRTSPFQTLALKNCLNILTEEDTLLLIEDAVISSCCQHDLYPQLKLLAEQGRLMVLEADLDARGLENNSAENCSYSDFVNLVITHKSQMSW